MRKKFPTRNCFQIRRSVQFRFCHVSIIIIIFRSNEIPSYIISQVAFNRLLYYIVYFKDWKYMSEVLSWSERTLKPCYLVLHFWSYLYKIYVNFFLFFLICKIPNFRHKIVKSSIFDRDWLFFPIWGWVGDGAYL